MEGEKFSLEKKEKPPFLYHASANREIQVFEPRAENTRDRDEGPVIFATPDLALATTFLVKETNDSWTRIGKRNGVTYMIISDKERFLRFDKGGSIYKFKNDGFTSDPNKGMGKDEWTSKNTVTPIEKDDVESAIDTMIENGVQVFFIDKTTFEKIKNTRDYDDILKTFDSENKKLGKNVIDFRFRK